MEFICCRKQWYFISTGVVGDDPKNFMESCAVGSYMKNVSSRDTRLVIHQQGTKFGFNGQFLCIHVLVGPSDVKLSGSWRKHDFPVGFGPGWLPRLSDSCIMHNAVALQGCCCPFPGPHLVDIPLAGFVLDDGSSPCMVVGLMLKERQPC
ncbi:hypothetical protein M0R45_026620 [Rubus argutus]|uniref:Uncharacterized protein n=1 Tax=Rubus argutus TaxID=59490 RepID=A0AAW1WZD6_RUBAR